jgi:hypothetical protein
MGLLASSSILPYWSLRSEDLVPSRVLGPLGFCERRLSSLTGRTIHMNSTKPLILQILGKSGVRVSKSCRWASSS